MSKNSTKHIKLVSINLIIENTVQFLNSLSNFGIVNGQYQHWQYTDDVYRYKDVTIYHEHVTRCDFSGFRFRLYVNGFRLYVTGIHGS